MKNKFSKLSEQVRAFLEKESSGHDFYHSERVFNTALHIQEKEGGDEYVIDASALVHDICRPWEKKTGKSHFGEEALGIIREVLINADVPKTKIQPILDVVALHDVYDWTKKISSESLELQIVQDADNLDAIGAIGIARTFMFGGHYGRPMYLPGENLEFHKDFVDGFAVGESTLAHFYEKLLKLKENMNTKTGRKLAERRHQVMQDFLQQFFTEWESKFE